MVHRSGLAVATALLVASCATPPAAPTSIEEAGFITLGGIEQWVTIRGDDAENPVLLVVHGGPGDVLSPYVEEFAPYEADYVVVQWDQRGAGRTYGRLKEATPDLTLEQVADDGTELAAHLSERFGEIIVLGHSWGSVVAVEMVKRRPELFSAYVGTGQVSSWADMVQAQFDYLVDVADRTGDAELAAMLSAIGTPDPANAEQYFRFTRPLRSHLNPSDAAWLGNLLARAQEVSTPEEFQNAGDGMSFSGAALFPTIMAEDLPTTAPTFEIPFVVIQGADDVFTPTEPALAYYDLVDAPEKRLVTMDAAGHFALVTHQNAFVSALNETARPFAD